MSCVVTFTIFPMGKGGEESLSPYVARVIRIVEKSGIPYQLGAMGTVLEGEFDEIMAVIKKCHDALHEDNSRVYLTMAVDSKAGGEDRMTRKVKSVEERL
ncbi:MTH1187 family thiamine-binding protein [uncultured Pseudodesulfovibrio sp.]|uniref:MTH1187 family thiamine-binding protein n=1 Tax=uncultured Pseudodesulfovibrio sp. TaxID=2035858 RepID=UPI0029C67593|nr:MTH1187 family thiamine-binding protein [uncultured Pseudodesulfovibrio sp.]